MNVSLTYLEMQWQIFNNVWGERSGESRPAGAVGAVPELHWVGSMSYRSIAALSD